MSTRAPKNFTIQIGLDDHMNFVYKELFSGDETSSLVVINGDKIAWILDPAIPERTLQIDFGTINPFNIYKNVSLRGLSQVTTPPGGVNFPSEYVGNRVLKYTVSLGNGLYDDPDIVPVDTDPGGIQGMGKRGLAPDFAISWVDPPHYTQAVLIPPKLTKRAGGGQANVTWKWQDPTKPTPPFQLDFTYPPPPPPLPPGWPAATQYSTDSDPTILLGLAPNNAQTQFTIGTTSNNGAPISVPGSLEIDP